METRQGVASGDKGGAENREKGATSLRPTTLTTLIAGEDEKRDVPCIHGTPQDACAVCSGYARWLAADGERLRRAQADPEAVRREFWREVPV